MKIKTKCLLFLLNIFIISFTACSSEDDSYLEGVGNSGGGGGGLGVQSVSVSPSPDDTIPQNKETSSIPTDIVRNISTEE